MSRNVHLFLGVLLLIAGMGKASSAQEPTLSLGVVAINGVRLTNSPLTTMCAIPGDQIDIEVYIRDWSVSKQPLAGYQIEVDIESFTSGGAGVIEPVGLQTSIETNKPDTKSSYVDRKHPRFVFKGVQSLDVTKKFGIGYRVASAVIGDIGPISNQDGTLYYAGTMDFVISDNAAGKFVLIPSNNSQKSVLVDHNAESIASLHCEPIVIHVCDSVDALTVTGFIDDLLSTERKPSLQLPCASVVVDDNARIWLGLDALNARLFSLNHNNDLADDLLTLNQSIGE